MTVFDTPRNWVSSTLAIPIAPGDTSISVAAGEGGLFGSVFPMVLVLDYNLPSSREIVKATSRVGDVIQVTRAQESTTATAHVAGTLVRCNITAGQITDLQDAINYIETDLTIPNVDDDTEKALLVPKFGKVCFKLDTKTFEICIEEV